MASAERRAATLDTAWDAVVRGEPGLPTASQDETATALLARLRATTVIPTLFPDPERSWRELRADTMRRPAATPWADFPLGIEPDLNGWHDAPEDRQIVLPRRSPRRWFLNQLATAALLLLALGAGILVLWQGAGRERDAETWMPDAAVASIPGYAEDVLFEATFAAEELPPGPAAAIYYRVSLPPGAALPSLAATHCIRSSCNAEEVTVGVGAELVEAGTYGLQLDRPLWVQRAGASAKVEIAPGQQAVLHAGDAAVFHDYTATGEIRNAGSAPLDILGMVVVNYGEVSEAIPIIPPEIASEQLDLSLTTDWEALPDGPVKVTLRRVTLPAETLMPPFEPRGLESIRVEGGSIAWTFAHSAEAAEGGLRIHRRAGETAPFAVSPTGAMRFLESTGSEPAELLVLTIEPAGLDGNPLSP